METGDGIGRQEEARQNCNVQPLLTDLYQITMAYAYWKSGKIDDRAVFDLYFRKNPFQGEFTVFAGLEECLKFLKNFSYSDSDIEYLKKVLPASIEQNFYEFLRGLTPKDITLSALEEGSVAFPGVPLIRVEGPLIVGQLLETTLLTLTNFASLMATNAARYRLAAGDGIKLLEFGLRRAQGPDGGLSASRYAHLGGFDGTSNLLAGKLFGIPVAGTHAHSYVTAFSGLDELHDAVVAHVETGASVDLRQEAEAVRNEVANVLGVSPSESSDGELAALVSYAVSFPATFTALVDTYDVVRSGLPNFCTVAIALAKAGKLGYPRGNFTDLQHLCYQAKGIRIDSGDLAYLSTVSRAAFGAVAERFGLPWLADVNITASNDINEETIHSLKEQRHCINTLGIGTHLVTCQRQPALGCVYKMVEVNGRPRIKLSQDVGKVTMPGKKAAYRLFGHDGHALVDLVVRAVEPAPVVGEKVLCRHPFQESKRAYVAPSRVQPLLTEFWRDNAICQPLPALPVLRERVATSLATLRPDIKRHLNPTPYKVAVSVQLYNFIHTLWLQNAPIGELA